MLRILVEDESGITMLIMCSCTAGSDLEHGHLVVIDSLDANGTTWVVIGIGREVHIVFWNTDICFPGNK